MEIVSELLEYSTKQTTQYSYTSVMQKRISFEIEKIKGK
jgi:hypothetical protein